MRHHLVRRAALALLVACAGPAQAAAAVVQAVGDAVVFDGRIEPRSAAQFLALLRDPAITRLVITSRGGIVSAALDMALAIHEHGLDLEVPTACLSSCANYIFPAARRKSLGRPDAVAWHGNMAHVLYLQHSGQERWDERHIEEARQLARREAVFFRRIGVDGFVCWFGKIAPYNADDFYYLSVEDLARFGIRDVTVRESSPGASPDAEGVRKIHVDWPGLEAARPAVPLD